MASRGVLLGQHMASDVSSASDPLASLLEDGLRTLLVDLVHSAERSLDGRADVPLLHGMNVGLESIAGEVWVSLESTADKFSVAWHAVW